MSLSGAKMASINQGARCNLQCPECRRARLQSIMRLVLHCHSEAERALAAPDKGLLRVSHKSQALPTAPQLVSHRRRKSTREAQRWEKSRTKRTKKVLEEMLGVCTKWGWKCGNTDEARSAKGNKTMRNSLKRRVCRGEEAKQRS